MKKKAMMLLLSFVFALVLVAAPTTARAEEGTNTEGNVAKVGETEYATLAEAIAAGGEVTVLKDVTLTAAITVSQDVTLTAESAVTITANDVVEAFKVQNGTLTFGKNITVNSDTAVLYAEGANSKIVIDGATIESSGANYCMVDIEAGATLEVKDGSLIANTSSAAYAGGESTKIIVSGGLVEATAEEPAYCAIFTGQGGYAEVTDGEVRAKGMGLVATTNGTVKVSGGTVSSVVAHESSTATAEITGGTIGEVYAEDGATLTITGGTFKVDPSKYVAVGYEAIQKDNIWTVAKAEIKVETGESSGSVADGITDENINETTIKDALNQNKDTNTSAFEEAVKSVEVNVTDNEAKTALGDDLDTSENAAPVELKVRPYLNVDVKAIEGDADNKTMTLDIKAMYNVFAVQQKTGQAAAEAKIDNAGGELTVTEQQNVTFTITVPLPSGFVSAITDRVVVEHTKDGSSTPYVYNAIIKENEGAFTATFENPNGFSTFVVKKASEPDVKYNVDAVSSLGFSFFVEKSGITATNFTATITQENKDAVVVTPTIVPVKDTDYYKFYYSGVAAKEMTDNLTLSIKDANNTEIFSNTASVCQYAMAAINDTTGEIVPTEKTLLINLLNYGAEAQKYFNYNVNNLANANLVQAGQASVVNEIIPSSNLKHNLALESQIELGFFVLKSEITGNNPIATINGDSVEGKSVMIGNVAYWRFAYSKLAAKEIAEMISFSVTGTNCTITDDYSVSAYAQLCINSNKPEKTLMETLIAYGDAANAHFNNRNNNN